MPSLQIWVSDYAEAGSEALARGDPVEAFCRVLAQAEAATGETTRNAADNE